MFRCNRSVSCRGVPPSAEMLHTALGDVLPMSVMYERLPATYTMCRPSGDHAGECASNELTMRVGAPPAKDPTRRPAESAHATRFPSGEYTAVGLLRRKSLPVDRIGRGVPPSAGTS